MAGPGGNFCVILTTTKKTTIKTPQTGWKTYGMEPIDLTQFCMWCSVVVAQIIPPSDEHMMFVNVPEDTMVTEQTNRALPQLLFII